MSYKPDYIYMQNIIVRAIESIITDGGGNDTIAESYSEMINFLETMYVNSVISLCGSMLTVSERLDDEGKKAVHIEVRKLLEAPKVEVEKKVRERYQLLVDELGLVDVFKEQSHNEKLAEAIKEEIDTASTSH